LGTRGRENKNKNIAQMLKIIAMSLLSLASAAEPKAAAKLPTS